MRRDGIRVDVDPDTLDEFAGKRCGSLREMATEAGVSERTLRRAKQNGFISLETAMEVCLAVDGNFEDVFGRQGEWLRTVIFLSRGAS